jgi:hypothetical protein
VTDEAVSIGEAGSDIFRFQPRIAPENRLVRITGGQHAQDMLDSKSSTTDYRLAAEYLRVDRNSLEKKLFVHGYPSLARKIAHLHREENLS